MASSGTQVFVVGEKLAASAQADETAVIHVFETSTYFCLSFIWTASEFETEHIKNPKPDPTPQITRERNPSPNGKTKRVPERDDNRVVELERQLSATLAAKTERDERLAQLTEELALKGALLKQAEANAAEATKRAGLEPRELADRPLAQTSLVGQKDAELVKMQAKLDELVLSRDQALQTATSRAAVADERSQRASEQNRQYETELAEVRAELKARKSELESVRLRLTDAEIGWAKSKTEADTLRALTTAGQVSADEDRKTRGLLERIRAMEVEMASQRWSEKSFEAMETRNEG
jgi:hypothetical protein